MEAAELADLPYADPRNGTRHLFPMEGGSVIYVSEKQLHQVEYLIDQSIQGNHILFDPEMVRRVFQKKGAGPGDSSILNEEEAYSVEHHIERLILQPTLIQKRAYLEKLDAKTYEWVVRTYFNIVENNIYEKLEVKH
jgi:hypothetical protein